MDIQDLHDYGGRDGFRGDVSAIAAAPETPFSGRRRWARTVTAS